VAGVVVGIVLALAFYGTLGGFLVQGLLVASPSSCRPTTAAAPAIVMLSVLDWIIRPW
jgi:hypothetical protein